jgi:transposase
MSTILVRTFPQIGLLENELRERACRDETAKRLMTIPGIGVICATAMESESQRYHVWPGPRPGAA